MRHYLQVLISLILLLAISGCHTIKKNSITENHSTILADSLPIDSNNYVGSYILSNKFGETKVFLHGDGTYSTRSPLHINGHWSKANKILKLTSSKGSALLFKLNPHSDGFISAESAHKAVLIKIN